MEIIGELLAVSNAVLYSLSNIFNKRALDQMDKDSGMVITLVVNNAVNGLVLLALFLSGKWVPLGAGSLIWFVLAGALTSFVGRYLLLESVNINGPSRAGAYKVASPVFTVFIGMFIIGEQINSGSMAGITVSLLGLWVISTRDLSPGGDGGENTNAGWLARNSGVLIGLGSGLAFAVGIAARKVGLQIWPSPVAGAFLGSMTALMLTLASFGYKGGSIKWRDMAGRKAVNYILSGLCTSVAILCFFIALQFTTVTVANVIASVEPLFTIMLAYWMLRKKERITARLICGAALVTVGAALIFIY